MNNIFFPFRIQNFKIFMIKSYHTFLQNFQFIIFTFAYYLTKLNSIFLFYIHFEYIHF